MSLCRAILSSAEKQLTQCYGQSKIMLTECCGGLEKIVKSDSVHAGIGGLFGAGTFSYSIASNLFNTMPYVYWPITGFCAIAGGLGKGFSKKDEIRQAKERKARSGKLKQALRENAQATLEMGKQIKNLSDMFMTMRQQVSELKTKAQRTIKEMPELKLPPKPKPPVYTEDDMKTLENLTPAARRVQATKMIGDKNRDNAHQRILTEKAKADYEAAMKIWEEEKAQAEAAREKFTREAEAKIGKCEIVKLASEIKAEAEAKLKKDKEEAKAKLKKEKEEVKAKDATAKLPVEANRGSSKLSETKNNMAALMIDITSEEKIDFPEMDEKKPGDKSAQDEKAPNIPSLGYSYSGEDCFKLGKAGTLSGMNLGFPVYTVVSFITTIPYIALGAGLLAGAVWGSRKMYAQFCELQKLQDETKEANRDEMHIANDQKQLGNNKLEIAELIVKTNMLVEELTDLNLVIKLARQQQAKAGVNYGDSKQESPHSVSSTLSMSQTSLISTVATSSSDAQGVTTTVLGGNSLFGGGCRLPRVLNDSSGSQSSLASIAESDAGIDTPGTASVSAKRGSFFRAGRLSPLKPVSATGSNRWKKRGSGSS